MTDQSLQMSSTEANYRSSCQYGCEVTKATTQAAPDRCDHGSAYGLVLGDTNPLQDVKRPLSRFEAEPEADVLEHRAAEIARLRERHPRMLDAPQPAPLPRVSGKFTLDPKAHFAEQIIPRIADGSFRLRRVTRYEAGLEECRNVGDCLAPLICDGDRIWVDPREVPQAGDVVLVRMSAERQQDSVNYIRRYPVHVMRYGYIPSSIVTKLLVAFGWDYWCIAADGSAFPLEGNQILGVVRRVTRQGWHREENGEVSGPHTYALYDGSCRFEIPAPQPEAGVVGHALTDDVSVAHAIAGHASNLGGVHTDTASAVTVTNTIHSPQPVYTTVCTVTFTPSQNCRILCVVSGSFSYTAAGGPQVTDGFWCDISGISSTASTRITQNPSGAAGTKYSINRSFIFNVLEGVSTTVTWGMEKFLAGDTLVVELADMHVTELN